MSAAYPFNAAKLSEMRAEILRDGLLPDKFLSSSPDVPTFGFNLACAWPFPEAWREPYEQMARRLESLGSEVYVYPYPFTHITLVTFVSFARNVQPSPELILALEKKIPAVELVLSALVESSGTIKPFVLQPQAPVLSRAAAILPMINPDGEVARLRAQVSAAIQREPALHNELAALGFNVPGIIHSTVMRFRQPPQNLERFLAAFDEIAGEAKFPVIEVSEILLTSETKPYMRGGKILRQFELSV